MKGNRGGTRVKGKEIKTAYACLLRKKRDQRSQKA